MKTTEQRGINLDGRNCNPGYRLEMAAVDVPGMINYAVENIPKLRSRAVFQAVKSPGWDSIYPTIKSFGFRRIYKDYPGGVSLFDRETGAVNILTHGSGNQSLIEFFNPGRIRYMGNFTQLRGPSYYASLDHGLNTPEKKLAVMRSDFHEGLDAVDSIDRRKLSADDFLLTLGILDHFKVHALTVFHALTFHERSGEVPEDSRYLGLRKETEDLMNMVTRAYYQFCIGKPFDSGFMPTEMKRVFDTAANYISESNHSIAHFTYPEVAQPAIIMLGAHEAVRRRPYIDTIVGIPSGGTETAVVTNLMYDNLYPDRHPLSIVFVPLSFHYYNHNRGVQPMEFDTLVDILTRSKKVQDRNVLIVDDNSNSGITLQTMVEAVRAAGASEASVHLAEIDPARIMARHRRGKGLAAGVVNMYHPDLSTAMGISGASSVDGRDLRRQSISYYLEPKINS